MYVDRFFLAASLVALSDFCVLWPAASLLVCRKGQYITRRLSLIDELE